MLHCKTVSTASCVLVNMMDVKLAQEPADIVWCYRDTGGLCGPSPQPAGKLVHLSGHIACFGRCSLSTAYFTEMNEW